MVQNDACLPATTRSTLDGGLLFRIIRDDTEDQYHDEQHFGRDLIARVVCLLVNPRLEHLTGSVGLANLLEHFLRARLMEIPHM